MNVLLIFAAFVCSSLATVTDSLQLDNSNSNNSTERLDLITFMAATTPNSPQTTTSAAAASGGSSSAAANHKLLTEKCNKQNGGQWNRRCQKFREREKQAKLSGNTINDIWNDADMLQHPIDEEPRRMDRALGEMCLYSSDCGSGCCMLDRETKIRSCQPKAIQGEKCTTAQIKGDLYVDVCPCESGDSNCVYPGEFCFK